MLKKEMKIVALLTDFGTRDPYLAQMKGVILRANPSVQLVDISHEIPPHNILIGMFFLKAVEPYFPGGTYFLAVVDPGVGTKRKALFVKKKGKFFLAPDNGILTPFLEKPFAAFSLPVPSNASSTFHGRDVFALHLGRLLVGERIEDIGKPVKEPVRIELPAPHIRKGKIKGEVLFDDRFGNLITNIPSKALSAGVKSVRFMGRELPFLSTYASVRRGRPLAVIGSFGNLEIAVREGSAKNFFGASPGAPVEVYLSE